jgi:hypothetical protein
MKLPVVLSSLAFVLFAGSATAEGVSIDPGLWEMTMTMTMTMMPQPQTTTVTECIKDHELNPESFNMDKDNPCQISDVTFEGDTARWSIHCPTEGGPAMEGQWEVISSGDSITGSGTMSADYNGQVMGFTMNWKGKRVGDCK